MYQFFIIFLAFCPLAEFYQTENAILIRIKRAEFSGEHCDEARKVMRQNIKSVLLLDVDKYPTNRKEIDQQCAIFSEFQKNLKNYLKCLNGLQRQAFNVFANGFKKLSRTMCSNNRKKNEAAETLSCATSDSMSGWNYCLDRTHRQLQFVAANSTTDNLVPDLCCVYPEVIKCLGDKMATRKDCPYKHADTPKLFKTILGFVMKDSLELVCSQYKSKQDCDVNKNRYPELVKIKNDDQIFLLTPIRIALRRISDPNEE